MKNYFNCLLFLAGFAFAHPAIAQSRSEAFISGDFADPSIIKTPKGYYAVGTSSEWAPHFPIYTSQNLRDWKQAGYVFDKAPEWTSGSFWAPEYYFHNNTYYLYYTARRKSDNVSCIGVATSQYPDKGFKDHGVIVSFGKEAIDAFVYNDNGQLYMTFKAYGLDKWPIELLGSRLSADGLKLEGEVFSMLKDEQRLGMEGQSILKSGDFYYLFYSSGNCCGSGCSYNVRVARSKNFKGPYEDYSQNPILQANEAWKCPGHGTFAKQDDGKYLYLYHAYNQESSVFTGREGMLAELTWQNAGGWPSFISRQADKAAADIATSFNEKKPAVYWQWDFRNSTPLIRQEKGKLYLSGAFKDENKTGVVLTVRPASDRFDLITTVTNRNEALKGLAFYGDANAAVGVGAVNDKVEFWMVKDNQRTVIATQNINAAPVQLKLTMRPDRTCEVFFKQYNGDWQPVAPGTKQDIGFLPQWDRSPRPGLHFKGAFPLRAEFSDFELINR
ncbi:glycoside hydrolase family 43 protein [Chitinophaga sp. GCM10012297]|uniref:Family 43 glycosylhydrolase n=1 Tax=Chitinophaga chungangae TaxID=2821488 RepID=A0ABS3YF45_9BACT|nr:glycoside hydrolase family 43 protein [Chitinophaga chungangae]MBO9153296.1 family 43 glycosylhydrolase [Chitinophaga chungangae]